jgi:hypothetical protein
MNFHKIILFFIILYSFQNVYAIGDCDVGNVTACIGRVMTLTRSSGNAPHYLDVQNFDAHTILRNGFTFETHIKLLNQTNVDRVYIAGVWGPFSNQNDSWVVYLDRNKNLVFEVNNATTNLADEDNTKAIYNIADTLWNKWFHLAVTWSPTDQFASIYLNGDLKVSERNSQYPANALRRPSSNLGLQVGSSNALYNTGGTFRTTLGEFDEIRIWSRPLSEYEINCNIGLGLEGNEAGLEVYYRCNSLPESFRICDATGRNREGLMRNGANCNNGAVPRRVMSEPFNKISFPIFPDTVKCVKQKTYSWTFTDTSTCGGERYWITGYKKINGQNISNVNIAGFSFNPRSNNQQPLDRNNVVTASVTVNTDFVGKEIYRFYVQRTNRCGRNVFDTGEIEIHRITELDYSTDSLIFGNLLANCIEEPYRDITFKIFNNTINTETNRPITITGFQNNLTNIFRVVSPSLPVTIPIGGSVDVTVRFFSENFTNAYFDELKIISNDNCEGEKVIPLVGTVTDVIGILTAQGNAVDSVNFGSRCINQNEIPYVYYWENLSYDNIQMTSVEIPDQFSGMRVGSPVTLEPNRSYQQRFFSFKPTIAGDYSDSIVFNARSGGCTIRKVVYVTGRGIDPRFDVEIDTLDFGDVYIGQTSELGFDVSNTGNDLTRIRAYLYQGDRFFISGGGVQNIGVGAKREVRVTFQPLEDSLYFDRIYIEEINCRNVKQFVLKGRGVTNAFEYNPKEIRTLNVLACSNRQDTIYIKNATDNNIELTNFQLLDPSTKFNILEPNNGNLNGYRYNLPARDSLRFVLDYVPNDVSGDRADQARLTYQSLGLFWELKVIGTSVVPKVYMTREVNYGTLEVGEITEEIVVIENISNADILLDSVMLVSNNNSYRLVHPVGLINKILKPRDSMHVRIEFEPESDIEFRAKLFSMVSQPCEIPQQFAVSSDLVGWGRIVPLEITQIALTMGQVKPCDCSTVEIPLRNRARYNDLQIDSIWIDDIYRNSPIIDGRPEYYSFSSLNYSGTFPYDIQVRQVDTLKVSYCPRGPWHRDSLLHNASIHVKASGPGWEVEDEVYLDGIQMLIFETMPKYVEFPPTRVDTLSVEQYSDVKIPFVDVNQANEPITIDSITFYPDNKVFFGYSSLGDDFPITISKPDSIILGVNFKPRAAREYTAQMYIHFSKPCNLIDSSITVYGRGFAPVFGLSFEFEKQEPTNPIDTFMIPSCDTLVLPVFSNRSIPGEIVDIYCNIKYDKNKFEYAGATSSYLDTSCFNYTPYITEYSATFGSEFLLKNFCYVDSLKPIFYAKFIPTLGFNSGYDKFLIDSIRFDTEEVILFDIIAEKDSAYGEVRFADHKILNEIVFDSIRVLECVVDTLYILNTGELNILVDELIQPISDIRLIEVMPLLGDTLFVGDTLFAIFEFCPSNIYQFDSLLISDVLNPCKLTENTRLSGLSYAPLHIIKSDISQMFDIIDTIFVNHNDTINVPVYINNDFFARYNDTDYWMENLEFKVEIDYNPRAMKYITSESNFNYRDVSLLGRLRYEFSNLDSMTAGQILNLKFLGTVSDSLFSVFDLNIKDFKADLMFLDLQGESQFAIVNSDGACNISILHFDSPLPYLSTNYPNPWNENTSFDLYLEEDDIVDFKVYRSDGKLMYVVFDNKKVIKGSYKIDLIGHYFENGVYFYELKSKSIKKSGQMVKLK